MATDIEYNIQNAPNNPKSQGAQLCPGRALPPRAEE